MTAYVVALVLPLILDLISFIDKHLLENIQVTSLVYNVKCIKYRIFKWFSLPIIVHVLYHWFKLHMRLNGLSQSEDVSSLNLFVKIYTDKNKIRIVY